MDVRRILALIVVGWCSVVPGQNTYNRQCECEYTVNGQCAYTLMLPIGGKCPVDSSSSRQMDGLQQNVTTLSAVILQQSERLGRLQEHVLTVQDRLAGLSETLSNTPLAQGSNTEQNAIKTLRADMNNGLRRHNDSLSRVQDGVTSVAANLSALQVQADHLEATQKSLLTRLQTAELTIARWARKYRLCSTQGLLVSRTRATSRVSSAFDDTLLGAGQARLQGSSAWCPREPNDKEWIQFDFSQERTVYGIVTRGRADYAQWVTSYMMSYSSDVSQRKRWTTFRDVIGEEMIFPGNTDQNTLQVNTLWQPISARFIRLLPLAAYQNSNLCMRADIIGCVDN